MLNDQRRAADDIVGQQLCAIVTRRRNGFAVIEHGVAGVELGGLRMARPPWANSGNFSISVAAEPTTRSVMISTSWSSNAWP